MNWALGGAVVFLMVVVIADGYGQLKRDERLASCEAALQVVSAETKEHAVRVIEELLGRDR